MKIHSPAPWTRDAKKPQIIRDANGRSLSVTICRTPPPPQDEANLQLMTIAPELADALKGLLELDIMRGRNNPAVREAFRVLGKIQS